MSDSSDAPLLATKMHVPRRRAPSVSRPLLVRRLDAGSERGLVIVTAPPGFGKSTLVAEWLATTDRAWAVAWVSLDDRDDSPRLFWRYVLTALARATVSAASALSALESPDDSLAAVLALLVNDLDVSPDDVVLVLDDFQVVADRGILDGLGFLIENRPSNLRIVISSRTDPGLPLGRLRASGDLAELRAADLRFTDEEVADYFRLAMDEALSAADSSALSLRTEGWIAAIQLAAISLAGRTDASQFVATFAGDDRFVVDYLMEEVLRRQPAEVRAFLLDTSTLSRFTSDLAQTVSGAADGAAMLEALDRANLFVVPLDDRREWYRYHHLFAQMLHARLLAEEPARVTLLHERASAWFERHGLVEDAVVHAAAAGSFRRAAALISSEAPALRRRRDESTLVRWLELLPAETFSADPMLSLELAGARLSLGRVDGVDELLQAASAGAPPDALRSVEGGVALYRAARALGVGDIESAERAARRAADLADADDHLRLGSAGGLRALAQWRRGDVADAEASWSIAVEELRLANHLSDALGGTIARADIAVARGRLALALALAQEGLDLARTTVPPLKGSPDMLVAIADVLRERDDLDGARRLLAEASALGEGSGLPQNAHRLLTTAARVHLAEGDAAGAIAAFDAAERVFTPDFFPDHHPMAAQRARAWLAAGRHREARDWVRGRGLDVDDDVMYVTEYEHLTLTRVLLADDGAGLGAARVTGLLERMLTAAEAKGRSGGAIEIRVLLALACTAAGDRERGLDTLAHAVCAAEPEGFVRVFADEGEPIARLLALLARRSPRDTHLRRLVDAARRRPAGGVVPKATVASALSEREREVLRMLQSDLGGADIARRLSVSLNTMRSHTKSIYSKLGVTSRRSAVTRAIELGLLPR